MVGKSRYLFDTLAGLWALIPSDKHWRLAALVGAMLVAAAMELLSLGSIPLFLSLLIDPDAVPAFIPILDVRSVFDRYTAEYIVFWSAAAMMALFLLKGLYLIAVLYWMSFFIRDVCAGISKRVFSAYVRSPYQLHANRNASTSVRNLTTEIDQVRGALNAFLLGLREVLVFCFIAVALLVADPVTSLSALAFLGLVAVSAFLLVRRRIALGGQVRQQHRGTQMRLVQQTIGALKVARILGHEQRLADQFGVATLQMEHVSATSRVFKLVPRIVLEVAAIGVILIIVSLSLLAGREVSEIIPLIALIAVCVVRLVPVLIAITSATTQLAFGRAAVTALVRDLNVFEEATITCSAGDSPMSDRQRFRELVLDSVTFGYSGSAESTLTDISLTLREGQSIGIVGPSGSGKSTLADVIMGLSRPICGKVLLDGIDIYENPNALGNLFGYVPQDIYLLDDTILQNIGFGIPARELDMTHVQRCVEDAQLLEFVKTLPEGINTAVGDRGARLSGGQRQRLGIARALYHNPDILVLDEATSALDYSTEEAVIAAIRSLKGSITTVTIAHRLTTLTECDVIYCLEAGTIVNSGKLREIAPAFANA